VLMEDLDFINRLDSLDNSFVEPYMFSPEALGQGKIFRDGATQ